MASSLGCYIVVGFSPQAPKRLARYSSSRWQERHSQRRSQANRIGDLIVAQTYQAGDKVVVVSGPDEGREATVVDNFRIVYGDDLTDGALVRFEDDKPSNAPVNGQMGVEREFSSAMLRRA
jgi:hypothetical protein